MDAPNLGAKIAMLRNHRFDRIFSAQQDGISHKRRQWMLIDDHILLFNEHCAKIISPSGTVMVHESIFWVWFRR